MFVKLVSALAVFLLFLMGGALFRKDRLHKQFVTEGDLRSERALVRRMRRMDTVSLVAAIIYVLFASAFATFLFFLH